MPSSKLPKSLVPASAKKSAKQLPLPLPTAPIIIVTDDELANAWKWIVSEINERPDQCDKYCVYDRKVWENGGNPIPLDTTPGVLTHLARLYLTSQVRYAPLIRDLVNDGRSQNVMLPTGQIDPDIRGVIFDEKRFRHALSEHLAFWTSLATFSKKPTTSKFMCSLPNVQPEDKGPDGLLMAVGSAPSVEIHSVKSSTDNPRPLISSAGFRKSGTASPKKQLDDFWRKANQAFGLIRLGDLVDNVGAYLELTFSQEVRAALLGDCAYNAVVVADDQFSAPDLFEGYERITNDVMKRIATYIGSRNWKEVATETQRIVQEILRGAGVL
ncbi:MAG TPA: hypothetical protein VFD70_08120 [Anaerolineae bacterium]|nr:hypothetical protein [Anaerolineae bacterium]